LLIRQRFSVVPSMSAQKWRELTPLHSASLVQTLAFGSLEAIQRPFRQSSPAAQSLKLVHEKPGVGVSPQSATRCTCPYRRTSVASDASVSTRYSGMQRIRVLYRPDRCAPASHRSQAVECRGADCWVNQAERRSTEPWPGSGGCRTGSEPGAVAIRAFLVPIDRSSATASSRPGTSVHRAWGRPRSFSLIGERRGAAWAPRCIAIIPSSFPR
jgi:hypothetical protein